MQQWLHFSCTKSAQTAAPLLRAQHKRASLVITCSYAVQKGYMVSPLQEKLLTPLVASPAKHKDVSAYCQDSHHLHFLLSTPDLE